MPEEESAETQHECAVCGTSERPERGWIFPSGDVEPVEIEDGDLRFEPTEDATALCSMECRNEFRSKEVEA